MLKEEIWKPLPGFIGLYEVSSYGRIRSIDHFVNCNNGKRLVKGKMLKNCDRGNGYLFVTCGKNGEQYNISIHRAVASAFIQNTKGLPEINHKDCNPKNNIKNNLEWCDRKYNNNYNNRAKKSAQKRWKKIIQIKNDSIIKIWESLTSIQNEMGFSIGNISSCCSGKRSTAYGYQWKWEE